MIVICENCNTEFNKAPCEIKDTKRNYCSQKCHYNHRKITNRDKEEKNPLWNGGSPKILRRYMSDGRLPSICQECKTKLGLHIHHIDGNKKNNTISNLEVLCVKCHLGNRHNHLVNYWRGRPRYGKANPTYKHGLTTKNASKEMKRKYHREYYRRLICSK